MDDLLSLSSTSEVLQSAANRYLYQDLNPRNGREYFLQQCLKRNPINTHYIRGYTCYEPKYLCWIWSNPLKLNRLELNWGHFCYPSPYGSCLRSRHPQLWIEELVLKLRTGHEQFLLRRLDTFDGLKTLKIYVDPDAQTLQDLINTINCPQLENLAIDGIYQYTAELDDKFPNLVSFDIGLSSMPDSENYAELDATKDCWETLSAMMDKSIFYRVRRVYKDGDRYWRRVQNSTINFIDKGWKFYTIILAYAKQQSLDPSRLIRWIALSVIYFNNNLSAQDYILHQFKFNSSVEQRVERTSNLIQLFVPSLLNPTKLNIHFNNLFSTYIQPQGNHQLAIGIDLLYCNDDMYCPGSDRVAHCIRLLPNVRDIVVTL